MTTKVSSVVLVPNFLLTALVLATWVYYRAPSLPRHTPGPQPVRENTFAVTGATNNCDRPCIDGDIRKCYFKFIVRGEPITSLACSDIERNDTSCSLSSSRFQTMFASINGQIPGPTIQVCKNDILIVDVVNRLRSEEIAIHWHGIHQKKTPYMDGVPMVSQCPIPSNSHFRYSFQASNPGTHFYHSHSVLQHTNGVFGALIVKEPIEKNNNLYDFDLEEHVMIISSIQESTPAYNHDAEKNFSASLLLISGSSHKNVKLYQVPHQRMFYVESKNRYRLRIINAATFSCPVRFEIEDHLFKVISKDGNPVRPTFVKTIFLFPGERYDIVLYADQEPSKYKMTITGHDICNNSQHFALLRYLHDAGETHLNAKNYSKEISASTKVTCYNKMQCIPELNGLHGTVDPALRSPLADVTFYMTYDLYFPKDFDNEISFKYHHLKLPYYPSYLSGNPLQIYRFNNVSFTYPQSPLLSQWYNVPQEMFCQLDSLGNPSCLNSKNTEFCECVHVLNVPLNKTVEIILADEGMQGNRVQTFHLHGHSFFVLGVGSMEESFNFRSVQQMNEQKKLKKNLFDPIKMDTTFVPQKGYVILRFYADNPGYWLMESRRREYTDDVGLQFILHVGEQYDVPPVPKNFPQCGTFKGPDFLFT